MSNDSVDNIFNWTSKQAYKSSCLNAGRWPNKNFEDMTPLARKISQGSLERRLSPKVFNNITEMYPVSQSMEDIKMQSELYEDLEPPDDFMKKHSLQDLTVLTADTDAQVCTYLFEKVWVEASIFFILFCMLPCSGERKYYKKLFFFWQDAF